jgi:hypothetical protein
MDPSTIHHTYRLQGDADPVAPEEKGLLARFEEPLNDERAVLVVVVLGLSLLDDGDLHVVYVLMNAEWLLGEMGGRVRIET